MLYQRICYTDHHHHHIRVLYPRCSSQFFFLVKSTFVTGFSISQVFLIWMVPNFLVGRIKQHIVSYLTPSISPHKNITFSLLVGSIKINTIPLEGTHNTVHPLIWKKHRINIWNQNQADDYLNLQYSVFLVEI